MKLVRGFYFPDMERVGWVNKLPVVDDRAVYQRRMLEAAVGRCLMWRTAVDAGAHVGLWSWRLAQAFRHVVSFEPVDELRRCLTANVGQFTNVLVRREAVGNASGTATLTGNSRKSVGWNTRGKGAEVRTSRFCRLDDLGLKDVDLVKMDIEGGEYDALLGAERTLVRCKPVVVIEEKHDPRFRATAYLQGLGMRCEFRKKNDRLFTWRR